MLPILIVLFVCFYLPCGNGNPVVTVKAATRRTGKSSSKQHHHQPTTTPPSNSGTANPASAPSGSNSGKPRPNIIFYLTDDLGYGEANQLSDTVGFPYDILSTPNKFQRPQEKDHIMSTPGLIKLANQGLRVLNNHSPSAVCAPSRAALWLGRSVGFNRIRSNSNPKAGIGELYCLAPDWVPWPRVVKEAGYETYFLGKWGLGANTGHPRKCGFDYFQGYAIHGGAVGLLPFPPSISLFNSSEWNGAMPDLTNVPFPENTVYPLNENHCSFGGVNNISPCTNTDDLIYQKAMSIVSQHVSSKSKPFFLVWAPLTPHAARWYFAPGTAMRFAPPETSPVVNLGKRTLQNFPTWAMCERGHAAQVENSIDRDMNNLLTLLQSYPTLDKNTLLIFTSDNGPQRECDPVALHNLPMFFMGAGGLRGHKTTMWEGGLRVPTLIRWPGKIQPGTTSRFLGTSIDLAVTILDVIGAVAPQPYHGTSMLQTWLNGTPPPIPTYFQTEICRNPWSDATCVTSTYQTTGWPLTSYKMIRHETDVNVRLANGATALYELFDLVKDPQEENSLVNNSSFTALLQEMIAIRDTLRLPYPSNDW